MPLPILAIASGAIKVGQKLFAGIRDRKKKKAEKKQAKADSAKAAADAIDAKLASFGLGQSDTGATPITQSGNVLSMLLGGSQPQAAEPESESSSDSPEQPFYKTPMGMGAIAIGLLVLLKVLKIIK